MTEKITITKPDDWHLHLRDGQLMSSVVKDSARFFGRAIIMPNLPEPVATIEQAAAYRQRILEALPKDSTFHPLMTLYLTSSTTPQDIQRAQASEFVHAIKMYPAGATTHSSAGIQSIDQCSTVLETMQKTGMPLSVHGEVTDTDVDIFDREKVFIDTVLTLLIKRFPDLKIVLEHLTTREAVHFVRESGPNLAATITAHHLLLNRNDLLVGGIKPHFYCLPIVKTEKDRVSLIKAATSGNSKFFLGTDSAPHPQSAKESAKGSAGIYSAHSALQFYAEIFDSVGSIDKLEGFSSFFGADFYGLDRNTGTISLVKSEYRIPAQLNLPDGKLIPLKAGENVSWRIDIPDETCV
ncbi:MAG: dihydroorotase [Proteobacteria bacterium]|nr:dihydroorotase [Pseudomonadota bacterium]